MEAFEEVLAVYRNTSDDCRLHVGNLALTTTEAELEGFFSGYHVKTISIMPGKKRNGLAYALSVWNATEARKAISELSGEELRGRKLSIHRARGTEHTPTAMVAREKRESPLKMRREQEEKASLRCADNEARRISEAQVRMRCPRLSNGAIYG